MTMGKRNELIMLLENYLIALQIHLIPPDYYATGAHQFSFIVNLWSSASSSLLQSELAIITIVGLKEALSCSMFL